MTLSLVFALLSSPLVLSSKSKFKSTFIAPMITLTLSFLLMTKTVYISMPKLNNMLTILFSDLMSSSLALLTIYLVILCYIVSAPLCKSSKRYTYNLILWSLALILLLCFILKNIFWFYIAFEFALIPTILCASKTLIM